jgi:hypothetical protein
MAPPFVFFDIKKPPLVVGTNPPVKSSAMQTYKRFFRFEAKRERKIMPEEYLGIVQKIEP